MNKHERELRRKALEEQSDRLIVLIIGIAMILLAYVVHVPKAHAQEMPNGNIGGAHTHDGARGALYKRWQIPDDRHDNEYTGAKNERWRSCCSENDCHIVQTKLVNGEWWFLSKHRLYVGQWRKVPKAKVETNYGDAELTPDGYAHACELVANGSIDGEILCFTPGDPEL